MMFRKQVRRLEQIASDMDIILENIIKQNEDINEKTKELLGEEIAEEAMAVIIEQEFTDRIGKLIEEAFTDG
jgi:anaerobic ribonucleoside-triphosphate reductase|tara:strand:- start:121 stop:336 length:216 start_codon:yes stop_codon:yes gene_type:complete